MKQFLDFYRVDCVKWGRLLFVGILMLFSATVFSQTKNPQLIVESPIHNFGAVPEGELVRHNFIIRNDGTEVLKIRNVSPT